MNASNILRSTLLAIASLAALATMAALPLSALTQTATAPANRPAAATASEWPAAWRTRDEFRCEIEQAMRDGSWRCLTNHRGWCSTPRR